MTRDAALAELREVLDESTVQVNWNESMLIGYLAEGQDLFCEETGYFRDRSTYTVTLAEGVVDYAISDRIIEVLGVFDGTRELGKFQEEDRSDLGNDWDPSVDPTRTGNPSAWQTDRRDGYISFDRTPTAAEDGKVLTLWVHRYSTVALDASEGQPALPSQFQRAPIHYAASMAFLHHDEEQQDPVKAEDHKRVFDYYVRRARRVFRRRHGEEVRVGTSAAYRV